MDIKIHVTAPMANSGAAAAAEEEGRRRPPVPPPEMPAFRKTGVAMMRPPLQETAAMVERQQSEMASHLTKFTTKFRKRSNTR